MAEIGPRPQAFCPVTVIKPDVAETLELMIMVLVFDPGEEVPGGIVQIYEVEFGIESIVYKSPFCEVQTFERPLMIPGVEGTELWMVKFIRLSVEIITGSEEITLIRYLIP